MQRMTGDYSWLDAERRGTEAIYAYVVHPHCLCHWEPSRDGPSSPTSDMPSLKLIARKRGCRIHGEKGWV